ncbi:MAG: hypothetical protein WCJ19_03245 [bacterium]
MKHKIISLFLIAIFSIIILLAVAVRVFVIKESPRVDVYKESYFNILVINNTDQDISNLQGLLYSSGPVNAINIVVGKPFSYKMNKTAVIIKPGSEAKTSRTYDIVKNLYGDILYREDPNSAYDVIIVIEK